MSDNRHRNRTRRQSPEPRRLPCPRPRRRPEEFLDPHRRRLGTCRRQRLQHPARSRAPGRPHQPPRRFGEERVTNINPGGHPSVRPQPGKDTDHAKLPNRHQFRILSRYLRLEEFDGTCNPAFDNGLEELERQLAELRLAAARELN